MRIVLFAFTSVFLLSQNAWADFEWSGSASTRYVSRVQNDGLSTRDTAGKDTSKTKTKQYQLRGNLGLVNKGEVVDFGFGVRTFSTATSEWLTVSNSSDLPVNVELAYAKAHKDEILGGEGFVMAGRQKTVILNDNLAQILFDKDVRWDGFGWGWKNKMFGLNLAQYVLGSKNSGAAASSAYSTTDASQSNASTRGTFSMLYSFQPHVKFKIGEEIEGQVAIAYHMWQGTGAAGSTTYSNNIHGGVTGTANSTNPLLLDNSRQWHLYTMWSFPLNFKISAEYVRNKKIFYGTRTAPTNKKASTDAYGLSLIYGQAKKKGEWTAAYSYMNKGLGAVVNTYSNSDMNADNIGHFLDAKYAIADNLTLGAKAQFMTEKAKLSGDGLAEPAPNQARKQSSKRYEFVAGVAF